MRMSCIPQHHIHHHGTRFKDPEKPLVANNRRQGHGIPVWLRCGWDAARSKVLHDAVYSAQEDEGHAEVQSEEGALYFSCGDSAAETAAVESCGDDAEEGDYADLHD